MSSKKSLLISAFLFFALLASLILVFRTTIFFGKAATGNTSLPDLANSYLFASPLQAKADSQSLPADRREQIRITVFLLDGRGLGISGKTIKLNYPSTLIIANTASTTDDSGKAIFDISSPNSGSFTISAQVDSQNIPQQVKVMFY